MNTEIRGIIYIILSGFFYGFLGYFGYQALKASPDVANMLFWRFVIASIFIILILLPQIKNIHFKPSLIISVLCASGLFYGTSTFTYFLATGHINTGPAMVIFFTYPAMVILFNRFFYKNKISPGYYLSVVLILMGLLLLMDINGDFSYTGVILSLVSGAGYAAYIIASKRYEGLNPLLAALVVCMGCGLYCLIHALSNQSFSIPSDPQFWLNSIGLGILSTAFPVLLLLQGLKYTSSEKAAILGVLEPIFVTLMGIILLEETLGLWQTLGVIIILGGALLSLRAPPQKVNSSD